MRRSIVPLCFFPILFGHKLNDRFMSQPKQPTNYGALSTLVTVFFFWGFIAAGNSVFIPFCKNYFHLDQFQSQLIDFAFYLAYYIGALFLFAYGIFGGQDLVGKWGYKKSIIYGLLFSSLGAAAMIIGDTGLVIPSGQPACLIKAWWAMAKLSAGSRQSLGASARMRILEHFSLDEIARQYADTYRQMLG